jgi:putative endonuclease
VTRRAAEQRGHWGESVAAWWLRLHGWRILARREKLRIGEIDLVAKRGRTIAFVEVKTRSRQQDLDIAIDARRLRRVAAAANALAPRYAKHGEDIRIDVILVAPFRRPMHIPNAWHG